MNLIEQLERYTPEAGHETDMYHEFLTFITSEPDCFQRTLLKGHVTASALVIDPSLEKVLLIHHKKLNRWLQPGGHCDGNPDTLKVAGKEVLEETGAEIRVGKLPVFDIDIHLIPEHKGIPPHFHYDVRYCFETDARLPLIRNHETNALAWIPYKEVRNFTEDESVLRMIRKLGAGI